MIRILGGEFRSRQLLGPPGEDLTRPMNARVKDSLFNLLRGWFEDARVLDLFSGVGTMGLEAASRGAAEVVCIERDRTVRNFLLRNIESLGCGDRVRALSADALAVPTSGIVAGPFDVVFMDPPYAFFEEDRSRARVIAAAAACRGLMGERGFLVLRRPVDRNSPPPPTLEGFDGPEVHDFGKGMQVLLYCPAA
ncbi:MAG: RsmD family RNA methyltransferase [Phycisphaerales bacterium]|jgi:16S rRNA (guanine966-N2)-methyltransferase